MAKVEISTKTLPGLLKATDKRETYWDVNMGGFGLKVQPTGRASWVVQKDVQGETKSATLGYAIGGNPLLGLAAAQKAARKWLGAAAAEHDPFAQRDKLRADPSFGELINSYLDTQRAKAQVKKIKASTLKGYETSLRLYARPQWGKVRFRDITARAVEEWTANLAEEVPGYAAKAVGHCSQVVRHAVKHKWITGDALTLQLTNPFADVETKPERVERDRTASPDEYARIQAALADPRYTADYCSDTPGRRQALLAVEMLLLSGKRKNQVVGIRLGDIHDNQGWVYVGEKMRKDGNLTLTGELRRLLARAKDERRDDASEWLFPALNNNPNGGSSPIDRVWGKIRRDYKLVDDRGVRLSVHDLRRSFNSTGRRLNISELTLERLLGHEGRSTLVEREEGTKAGNVNRRVYSHYIRDDMIEAAEAITAKIRSYQNNDTDADGPDIGDITRNRGPVAANDNPESDEYQATIRHS